ncbi:MAG TPA: TspO/MBR family protein [Micromonosporaceae bacterium]
MALGKTSLAVAAAAVAGAVASDPRSVWYQNLRKPPWQPPGWAYGAVWTPLYGLLALAGARALRRAEGSGRTGFLAGFATNLTLNAAWTPLFFRAKAPRAALADIVALDAANVALIAQAYRIDRVAAAALVPYAAWTGFATALNLAIVRRNRD